MRIPKIVDKRKDRREDRSMVFLLQEVLLTGVTEELNAAIEIQFQKSLPKGSNGLLKTPPENLSL
jgi:hypothetical protein